VKYALCGSTTTHLTHRVFANCASHIVASRCAACLLCLGQFTTPRKIMLSAYIRPWCWLAHRQSRRPTTPTAAHKHGRLWTARMERWLVVAGTRRRRTLLASLHNRVPCIPGNRRRVKIAFVVNQVSDSKSTSRRQRFMDVSPLWLVRPWTFRSLENN